MVRVGPGWAIPAEPSAGESEAPGALVRASSTARQSDAAQRASQGRQPSLSSPTASRSQRKPARLTQGERRPRQGNPRQEPPLRRDVGRGRSPTIPSARAQPQQEDGDDHRRSSRSLQRVGSSSGQGSPLLGTGTTKVGLPAPKVSVCRSTAPHFSRPASSCGQRSRAEASTSARWPANFSPATLASGLSSRHSKS